MDAKGEQGQMVGRFIGWVWSGDGDGGKGGREGVRGRRDEGKIGGYIFSERDGWV